MQLALNYILRIGIPRWPNTLLGSFTSCDFYLSNLWCSWFFTWTTGLTRHRRTFDFTTIPYATERNGFSSCFQIFFAKSWTVYKFFISVTLRLVDFPILCSSTSFQPFKHNVCFLIIEFLSTFFRHVQSVFLPTFIVLVLEIICLIILPTWYRTCKSTICRHSMWVALIIGNG